jgi:hypothetical protein
MVSYQVGELQIFEVDRAILAEQGPRGLVVKVGALSLDRLVRPLEARYRLAPALAPLLAFGDAALRLRQLLLIPAM